MSLFRTEEIPCPSCTVPVTFELVHSINADRRADFRQQILDRTFQKEKCPSCGFAFRTEPEFTLLHMGKQQWLAAWPASKLPQWQECEAHSQKTFDSAFGASAPPAAGAIGKELIPRVTFGWEGLHEKLATRDAGIDDCTLEIAKITVARTLEDTSVLENLELRFLGIDPEGQMLLGWFDLGSEALDEVIAVPRTLLDEVEAAPADWQSLREQLSAGLFVDMQRLLIAAEPGST